MPKFYLTTPIYYVNARPHIGHAYTTIVADVLARRSRAQGNDTWFLTGTDEHGQKIERSAAAAGIPPQAFTDEVSHSFKSLWDRMGLTYDQYIRTTDEAHKCGVQQLWKTLEVNGHIYLSSYTGQYCVSEEIFVEGPPGTIGPDGRPTETVTEENYFFRLSNFQRPLIDLIESNKLEITPESRRNELLSFLRGNTSGKSELVPVGAPGAPSSASGLIAGQGGVSSGARPHSLTPPDSYPIGPTDLPLNTREEPTPETPTPTPAGLAFSTLGNPYVPGALRDLSISRSSFTWGIPVPGNPKHVIYVWLDALANYLTAVGYGDPSPEAQAKFARFWPADLHLVGKEIIRQHCIYWPAFLMAAELPLPKKVVAHGWLLFEESKMSKSKGNIVRTETILEAFGSLCPPPPANPPLQTEADSRKGPALAGPLTQDTNPALAAEVRSPSPHDRDLFAADVLRYFLLREIPFGQDGSFSFDALITRYNADLANGYGNLVSRTLKMVQQYLSSAIPTKKSLGQLSENFIADLPAYKPKYDEDEVIALVSSLIDVALGFFAKNDFAHFVSTLTMLIASIDEMLSKQAPWKIDRSEEIGAQRIASILYTAAESIRIITALLHPILPYATANVWRQLGLGDIKQADLTNLQWGGLQPGTKLGPLSPIFPRADKGLATTMTNLESSKIPVSKLTDESFTASPHAPNSSSDPAAPPATSTFTEPNPGQQVAGSTAETTERPTSPSHTEMAPSGIFKNDQSPEITIADFAKVELRVAQVLVCERIPKADKLLRLEVDLGYERRQILSGIAEWYTPEDLIGRRIVVITNLAPRKMRGLESHGMLLAASSEGGKPALATFLDSDTLPLGSRLK